LGIMDIKADIRKTVPQEFVTPQTKEDEPVTEQSEIITPAEDENLERARGVLAQQENLVVSTPTVLVRPAEPMTAEEYTALGIDPSQAEPGAPNREAVLLNALLEVKVDPSSNNAGTEAGALQDLASGLEQKK
jgi:hypothetical protein